MAEERKEEKEKKKEGKPSGKAPGKTEAKPEGKGEPKKPAAPGAPPAAKEGKKEGGKKEGKAAGPGYVIEAEGEAPGPPAPPPRLLSRYREEVVPQLMQKFGHQNRLAVPRLLKVTINMGVGKAIENRRRIELAVRDLALISGQRPVITKSRQSIAGFKLRPDMAIGCKVTLRGKRMYEFLDRLVSVAIPRIRDFRGLSPKSFDKAGNYTFGISEQIIFPEVPVDSLEFQQGMDVTIGVASRKADESRELLSLLGFPFRQN